MDIGTGAALGGDTTTLAHSAPNLGHSDLRAIKSLQVLRFKCRRATPGKRAGKLHLARLQYFRRPKPQRANSDILLLVDFGMKPQTMQSAVA